MLYTRGHAHHLRRNKTPPSSAVNHAMSMTWAWREINNCETEITGNMRGTEGAAVKGRMPYKRTDNLFSIPVYVGDARVLVRHWHQANRDVHWTVNIRQAVIAATSCVYIAASHRRLYDLMIQHAYRTMAYPTYENWAWITTRWSKK